MSKNDKIDQIKHDIEYFESLKHDINIAYAECFTQDTQFILGNIADIIRNAIYTANGKISDMENSSNETISGVFE